MSKITLEEQYRLEQVIKAKGKWSEFKKKVAMLHRLYRAATLSESQYLAEHSILTLELSK